MTSCGTLMSCELEFVFVFALRFPYTSRIAGPAVTVSLAPSIPLGRAGNDLPVLAAAADALLASNVKTATAFGIAAYVTVEDTPDGTYFATGALKPAMV